MTPVKKPVEEKEPEHPVIKETDLRPITRDSKRLITSFVRPDVIAQLADAEQVLARIDVPDAVELSVLIPNQRGLERALAQRERFHAISCFLSASETHNRHNLRRSIEESLVELERVSAGAVGAGLRVGAVISVAFGCPYEGRVAPERVFAIARRLIDAGAVEIGFGDTTGMANPVAVARFFELAQATLGDHTELTAHFHNTLARDSRTWSRRSGPAAGRSSRASARSAAAPCRPERRATSRRRTSWAC